MNKYFLPIVIIVAALTVIVLYPQTRMVSYATEMPPPPVPTDTTTPTAAVLGEEIAPSKSIPTPTTKATPKPTTAPAIKLGVVVEDYANKYQTITKLEETTGKKFSTISIFKQFGNNNNHLEMEDLAFTKSAGKRLLIAWEPWDPEKGLSQDRDFLSEIIAGKQDSYISQFAQEVKQYGAPVTIRFGHEMNGNWYPWGQRDTDYAAAYKRIYNLFKSQKISNVTWMWSINAENVPTSPIANAAKYYPGAAYVDEIGLDGFNFGASQKDTRWVSFDQIFTPAYKFALGYNKPIIISETASSDQGGNKNSWISDMGISLKTKFPKVKEVIWFNLNKEADWRLPSGLLKAL
jgi:beta-mannanase